MSSSDDPATPTDASTMAVTQQQFAIDALRLRLGLRVIIGGFMLAGATILLALGVWVASWKYEPPTAIASGDIVAIVGSVTGIIGTVIGAFLGSNIGAAGRTQAEHERASITNRALNLAGALDPQKAAQVFGTSTASNPAASNPTKIDPEKPSGPGI